MELLENALYILAAAAEMTAAGNNFNASREELTGLLNRAYKKYPEIETDLELVRLFRKTLAAGFNAAGMVNTAIIIVRLLLQ